jgi:cystathionine gamma-synthase
MASDRPRPDTLAAQALGALDPVGHGLVPPVHVATTYLRDPDNQYRSGRSYARPDNPSFEPPERLLAALEGGAAALIFASGTAAAVAVFTSLRPGDHVIAGEVMYYGIQSWLRGPGRAWGLEVELVDLTDPAALAAALRPGRTRLVWAETPANPTWAITDLARTAALAHGAGARLAVDSTVATPILSRPIEHGADLVMHSATKYLNGHSDVVAGALVTAKIDEDWQRIVQLRKQQGAILGAFEAWLLLRGMRTLPLRMRQVSRSAARIALHLAQNTLIARVRYPGLPDDPGNAIAARQMQGGFGGMLSIELADGEEAAIALAAHVQLWRRATSLGGPESLIEHRASIEGPDSRTPRSLLRLSVGLEDPADLIADLDQALARLV